MTVFFIYGLCHPNRLTRGEVWNFYTNGVDNFQKKNYTVAIAHFEKAAELNPDYKDLQSRLRAAKKEMIRSNEITDRNLKREDETSLEFTDNAQLDYSSSELNSQQFIAEKGRQLDAAIDSQLVQSYYEGALDLMQKQDWQ